MHAFACLNQLSRRIKCEFLLKYFDFLILQELLCHHSVAWVQKVILAKFLALAQNPTFLQSCKATWWEQFLLDDELNSPEEELFTMVELLLTGYIGLNEYYWLYCSAQRAERVLN